MNDTDLTTIISEYLEEVERKYYSGIALEHAYRPALQNLIERLCPDVNAINDAKRLEVGAPDFVLTRQRVNPLQSELFQSIPLGFVEAKDIKPGILDKPENQEQLHRYMELGNVVHTDGLLFRFYFNKELVKEVKIGYINENNHIVKNISGAQELEFHFKRLVERHGRTIRTAKILAIHMADRARQIRHTILQALTQDIEKHNDSELFQQYEAFKKILIHDLKPNDFADIYAETIAYGLFAARYHDDTKDDFTLQEAAMKMPKTNPFLHKFFIQIAAYEKEDRLNWVLDNFAELFTHADVHRIMSTHGVKSGMNHDPIIHFYETFLGEYDPKRRKARGVYYTPLPVVQFIVRAVDDVLKTEFGLSQGLADDTEVDFTYDTQPYQASKYAKKLTTTHTKKIPRVQVLDPATGTGTFLNEVIKHIYEQKGKNLGSSWSSYVEQNLLPRLHGFELLMAAYAMAHMRLGLTLTETGYKPSNHPPRLSVYLTNTLEPPAKEDPTLLGLLGMTRTLSEESHAADTIKRDQPIMVVIGNPPYSVSSSNKSEFIENLTADYKKDLNERNIQPLSDDYIKFIRYAEHMIEKSGQGVVAMITNNSYFDGLIHRQMRKHLLKTFDKVHIIDLHGNSKKKESAPDGSKDENVFDIMQGVGIVIAVKKSPSENKAELFRSDIYGKRADKYTQLEERTLHDEMVRIETDDNQALFKDGDSKLLAEYEKFISVRELMPFGDVGVSTHRDGFVIDIDKEVLKSRIKDFYNLTPEELNEKYNLQNNRDFIISNSKLNSIYDDDNIQSIAYRPFDYRYIYYSKWLNDFTRFKTMRHMQHQNLALITIRRSRDSKGGWSQIGIINALASGATTITSLDRNYAFPLYRYENDGVISNFDENKLSSLLSNIEPYCFVNQEEDLLGSQPDNVITAIDVLDYIYGVLHSPAYRAKYKEFLKIDFPRIPKSKNYRDFNHYAELGSQLRKLHLMEPEAVGEHSYPFNGEGDNIVQKPSYKASREYFEQGTENRFVGSIDEEHSKELPYGNVYINETQCFAGVPKIAWEFYIGGYQPAQKWLKDRKSRELTYKDIEHYQKIIKILTETNRIMKKIDDQNAEIQ